MLSCYFVILPHHAVREKFSIPVDKVTVEDNFGTEVNETVFAELSAMGGICFVVKDCSDNGKSSQDSLVLYC